MADNVTKFQAATDRDREQLYSLTSHLLRSMKSQPIGNHGPEGYNHGYDVDTIASRMGDVMSAFGYTAEPPASNETLVADGDNTSVSNTGGSTQGTLNVSGGSLSGVSIADTTALVDDGSTLDVDGVSASISVSAGVQSAALPGTSAVVSDGFTYNDGTNTYTVSVSGGTITISHAAN